MGVREQAALAADGEAERSVEDAILEYTTIRSRSQGVQCSTFNTIEVQSIVSIWPLFWVWKYTTQLCVFYGATEAGSKEINKYYLNLYHCHYVHWKLLLLGVDH